MGSVVSRGATRPPSFTCDMNGADLMISGEGKGLSEEEDEKDNENVGRSRRGRRRGVERSRRGLIILIKSIEAWKVLDCAVEREGRGGRQTLLEHMFCVKREVYGVKVISFGR